MKDTRNVRCAKCGSENVYVKGDAVWNHKNHQWQFYPNNHNPDCDYEASCGSDVCKDDLISYAESVQVGSERDRELNRIFQILTMGKSLFSPPMKKYRVIAAMNEHLELEIEAENEDDAWKIAKETDGSEFSKLDYGDFWIDTVYEIEEEANE